MLRLLFALVVLAMALFGPNPADARYCTQVCTPDRTVCSEVCTGS